MICRWKKDSDWEVSSLAENFDWKRIAEPVMKLYTEATDGSYIETKDSALVWHHQDADPYFGSCQAMELLDHLENVLANEPVVVKRGQQIVEVKPQVCTNYFLSLLRRLVVLILMEAERLSSSLLLCYCLQGVTKGLVAERVLSTMISSNKAPDFVLCIGDDRSDEDMFESISSKSYSSSLASPPKIFACTVGQKPSKAKYYLDDTTDVLTLLQSLATPSTRKLRPSFETRVLFEDDI